VKIQEHRIITEHYIQLAHKVDHLLKQTHGEDTTVVDCYFGPSLEPAPTNTRPPDPDELLSALSSLRHTIRTKIDEEPRRTFLYRQTEALSLLVRFALDEPVSFEERVRVGLDVEVVTVREGRIEELQEEAYRALRRKLRKADLATMAKQWRKRSLITGSELMELVREVAEEARRHTQRLLFRMPEGENVEFREVRDAPWSAYHHYQGNYSALIEVNTRLPRSKYGLWRWVTHETYPGHQTQLVSRELNYRRGTLGLEATIALINTPDCTLSEGLAEAGATILSSERPFSEEEQITSVLEKLRRAVGINAVVMLNRDELSEEEALEYLVEAGALEEEYAKARLPFMTHPIWAPYGFTYYVGSWLVGGFFQAASEANLLDEFIKALYHELHTPSTLKRRIRQLELKLPPLQP